MRNNLKINNFGQVKKADISFGDLTVFVGPQATGKSIALQLFKLIQDNRNIVTELRRHGLDWTKNPGDFFDTYFGEGMRTLIKDGTAITYNGKPIDFNKISSAKTSSDKKETMFFIPAQRVLTLRDGWPRPFTDYAPGDPFAVREYSEALRQLMEKEFSDIGKPLFPHDRRLKVEIKNALSDAIFHGFDLKIDKFRSQKRLTLGKGSGSKNTLPFMVWSAGQREFVPLLLGLYWLLPPSATLKREQIEWVVIEELEMGLHTQAISATMLLVMDLIARGYRVCISTHSTQVLDIIWALNSIKKYKASADTILDIFDVPKKKQMKDLAESVLKKEFHVYAFDRQSGKVSDISNLDPGSENINEAGWGGLSEFSGHVADIVANVVAGSELDGGKK
jgi:hypothetical protein